MKKYFRNSIISVLCLAAAASAGSCAAGQTYPVTVDGEALRAGIYIMHQQNAINSAMDKLNEEQPDLDTSAEGFSYLNQTVEGKSFADWVNEKTLENCRSYVAAERLFDSYGLTLDADQVSSISSNTKSIWTEENMYAQYIYGVDTVGEYYEKLGIGEQSFKDYQTVSAKRSQLFEHLYGEDGELAATQDEINNALKADYLAVNFFPYDLENGDGAQAYADRIAGGESYEDVYRDYAQALTDEEAVQAADETAETDAEEGAGEQTETAAAQSTEIEVAEKDSLIQILSKDSASPSQEFIDDVSAMSAGDVKVITVEDEDHSHVYVVQKLDILAYPDKTESAVTALRTSLKSDEFSDMLISTGSSYTLTEDSSKSMYKLEKLLEN